MSRLTHYRPSPAMIVACAALLISLGGVSYAAITLPANSVTTKQVKNYSLLNQDFKRGQLPRGAAGPKGDKGDTGPSNAYSRFVAGPINVNSTTGATRPLRGTS